MGISIIIMECVYYYECLMKKYMVVLMILCGGIYDSKSVRNCFEVRTTFTRHISKNRSDGASHKKNSNYTRNWISIRHYLLVLQATRAILSMTDEGELVIEGQSASFTDSEK